MNKLLKKNPAKDFTIVTSLAWNVTIMYWAAGAALLVCLCLLLIAALLISFTLNNNRSLVLGQASSIECGVKKVQLWCKER